MIDGQRWYAINQCDPRAVAAYLQHYSSAKGKRDARALREHGFVGLGEKLVLLTNDGALFSWVRSTVERMDGQVGVNCNIFRTARGGALASDLIREAEQLAWVKWPGERLFTFVDAAKTARRRSKRNPPGHCFIEAGWTPCGESAKGLLIFEKLAPVRELAEVA